MPKKKPIYSSRAMILAVLIAIFSSLGTVSRAAEDDFGLDLPVVRRIIILGNVSFDDNILKKRMRTKEKRFYHIIRKPKYRRDFLRRDLESLKSFYHKNGFFQATVQIESIERNEESNNVTIRIMIHEGPQTKIRMVNFSTQPLIDAKDLRSGLQLLEGNAFNPNLLEVDQYTLFSKFFEKGYLGASVSYSTVIDSIEVDISWTLDPGIPMRIDTIRVSGNEKVNDGLVYRELVINPGEYFKLPKIVESKQNLYNTGYFNSVDIEPAGFEIGSSSVDLDVIVRERKKGYIEAGFGVGNVHANRVFGEWGQRNLLGRGYALNLRGEYAFRLFRDNEYRSEYWDPENRYILYKGSLLFPHILGTWNSFTLGASYEYDANVEPAVVRIKGFDGTLSRRFSRATTLLLSYSFENVKRENVEDEKESSRRRSIDLGFRKDTRDFYFNPTRGRFITLDARFAGGLLGGDDDYYSFVPTMRTYRSISDRTLIAYRFRFGYSNPFGNSAATGVPIESRFFAGGANSVRGFRENDLGPKGSAGEPRGGEVLILGNIELRFPLPWISKYNFGGVVFLDCGNVWENIDMIKLDQFDPFSKREEVTELDFRYSLGFGMRYHTPVGPIRIDVGYPLKLAPGQDTYLFHISLGQIF
jgi:outer membrane protein insertion porin family